MLCGLKFRMQTWSLSHDNEKEYNMGNMRFVVDLYMPAYQKTDGVNFDWNVLANNSTTSDIVANVKSSPYYTPGTGNGVDTDVVARLRDIATNHSSVTRYGYVDAAGHKVGGTFVHQTLTGNIFGAGHTVDWNNGNAWDLEPQIKWWLNQYLDTSGHSLIQGIMFDNVLGYNTDSTGNTNRDAYYTMIHDNMRANYSGIKIHFGCGGVFPTTWINGTLGTPSECLFDRINANEVMYDGTSTGFPIAANLATCVTSKTGGVYDYSSDRFSGLLTKGNTYAPGTLAMNDYITDCSNNNIRYVYVTDKGYSGAMPSFWSSEVTYVASKP